MAQKPRKPGKLNNSFTHFGAFTWRDDKKLVAKIEEIGQKLGFYRAPVRLKVKLGAGAKR